MRRNFLTYRLLPVFIVLILTAGNLISQVTISGRITDANGNPLAGASIQVKNQTLGTTSSADGSYQLSANLKNGAHTIQFSSVGFKTEERSINVNGRSTINLNVSLAQDVTGLDEVVVTGTAAGTTRRQLGSYISTVKAEDLTKGATGNVLAALQGKTAGAQIVQNSGDPGGGISVRLRGISSISSSSEPLYIIDGVIANNATNRVTNTSSNYDGSNFIGTIGQNRLVDINPNDIERIEVLNGAAAAAIYGSRANAGVVQIFTKRGRSGAPQVTFSTNVMVSQLRKKVPVNQAPVKFGGSPDLVTQDILTPTLTTTTPVTRYDYQDYIYRTAIGTDNNVSISGGTEKTKYYMSGSYFYNQGIVKNTDFQRYSFRTNIDQTLTSWLTLTTGLNYINSKENQKPNGQSFFSPLNSINIIGNFHDIWARDALGNLKAVGERGRVNPVSVIEDIKQQENTSRVIASAGLKLKPTKNLSIDYTLGIDNYSQYGTTYIPPFAYNVNTAFYGGGTPGSASFDALNGYASAANNTFFAINHDVNANLQYNISTDLAATTQLGFSQQYERNNYVLAQGRGLAPGIQTVTAASTFLPSNDDRSEISISGAYLQQNFKYMNQLFITGALRVDGSSVFGKSERNQVYVKASGSYVFSGLKSWNFDWWNLFKIRAAYGESGNLTGIGAFSRFNNYTSNSFLGKNALVGSTTLANTNVRPERQGELEIGTDLSFFKDKFGLTVNWYNKKVKDLLINRLVAPTTGYSSLLDNIGSLENKGFEIVVTGNPYSNKNFSWNITGILNHNKNKAVSIGQSLILLSTNAGAPVAIIEGQPIGVFYGTFFATDAAGTLIKNSNGIPQTEKGVQNSTLVYTPQRDPTTGLPTGTVLRKVVGDPNPRYTGSLVNELRYKKWDFRFQLDAVQGVDVWNADWRTRQGVGNGEVAEQEDLGNLPRGYVAGIYAIEEWRVDNGSFVKLRELSLGYHIGKIKGFSDITINAGGRNLISWDKYKGYDPEVNAGGQSTILRGIDFGSTPIPRTFTVGISAKF
jgi:TonB-linked SusC/RagA family outer membrane protein